MRKFPRDGRGYRTNRNVSKHAPYPITRYMRVPPLYRRPDGTWPSGTAGHEVGGHYAAALAVAGGRWRRMYLPLELWNEDGYRWCSWSPTKPSRARGEGAPFRRKL